MFFNRFWPKSNWSTKHFLFDLNLELHSGLKVRGSEINFINKKLLKSKNPRGFVIPVLKVEVTNPRGFFDSSNFLLIKLISDTLTLRPLYSSRSEIFDTLILVSLPWEGRHSRHLFSWIKIPLRVCVNILVKWKNEIVPSNLKRHFLLFTALRKETKAPPIRD